MNERRTLNVNYYINILNVMLKPFSNAFEDGEKSRKEKFIFYFFLTDLILFNFALLISAVFKNYFFNSLAHALDFILISNVSFLVINSYVKKYTPAFYIEIKEGLWFLTKTIIEVLFLNAFIMVLFKVYHISRIYFLTSFIIYSILLTSTYISFYYLGGIALLKRLNGLKREKGKHGKLNYEFMLIDFSFFIFSYFLIYYQRYHTLVLSLEHERMLVLLIATGIVAGLVTRKFEILTYRNFFYRITPFIKSFLVMFSLTGLSMFFLGWYHLSHKLIFGSISFLFTIELLIIALKYILKDKQVADIETIAEVEKEWQKEKVTNNKYIYSEKTFTVKYPIKDRLRNNFLFHYPQVFRFIDSEIDLNLIDETYTSVLNTNNIFNFEILDNNFYQLIVNLHKINDFRRLNRFLLMVHGKLRSGGYLVGQAHTLKTHKKWMYEKYPYILANIIYPIDFLLRRVIPKLPVLKKVYFFITRGRNRLISRAEILGRLYFCGFKVVAEKEIDNRLFFIAQKVRFPSIDRNPSYGPLIKLRRIGLGGKQIGVYKFRTMHPYSEYLQDYIYEKYNLQSNGKFANDFRITTWGKWMRRLWIDELPQLYNFLRGDLALFGVRALSPHYFSLYPQDLQKLRIKFKPGLVPPYYADMPNSFEEIVESERQYLIRKMQAPFITDCIYFTKAVFNIIFRKARSR